MNGRATDLSVRGAYVSSIETKPAPRVRDKGQSRTANSTPARFTRTAAEAARHPQLNERSRNDLGRRPLRRPNTASCGLRWTMASPPKARTGKSNTASAYSTVSTISSKPKGRIAAQTGDRPNADAGRGGEDRPEAPSFSLYEGPEQQKKVDEKTRQHCPHQRMGDRRPANCGAHERQGRSRADNSRIVEEHTEKDPVCRFQPARCVRFRWHGHLRAGLPQKRTATEPKTVKGSPTWAIARLLARTMYSLSSRLVTFRLKSSISQRYQAPASNTT